MQPNVVHFVPLDQIEIEEGFNARNFDTKDNRDHVADLARSIAARGVENPLRARVVAGENGLTRLILTDGESRLRAARKAREDGASLETVPVLIEDEHRVESDRIVSLVVKNTGKALTPLEMLNVIERLEKMGVKQVEYCRELGMTKTAAQNIKLLGRATDVTKQLVARGSISATLVQDLLREHKDPESVQEIVVREVAKAERKAQATGAGLGKVTKSKVQDPDKVLYSKGVQDGLIAALQDIYALTHRFASLDEATQKKHIVKLRKAVKDSLENANAPLVREMNEEIESDEEVAE
jgi:ParB-like chromosome segregation protein Spo0J